jgi:hypothetical protein
MDAKFRRAELRARIFFIWSSPTPEGGRRNIPLASRRATEAIAKQTDVELGARLRLIPEDGLVRANEIVNDKIG